MQRHGGTGGLDLEKCMLGFVLALLHQYLIRHDSSVHLSHYPIIALTISFWSSEQRHNEAHFGTNPLLLKHNCVCVSNWTCIDIAPAMVRYFVM